jgi:nicotinamide-nucleotide amidase
MVAIMEDEVLPRLLDRFVSDAIVHHTIVTVGEGESYIAEKIQRVEESLPSHIKLAYLPGAGMVKLRLTGKGPDEVLLNETIIGYKNQIAAILSDIVIAMTDMPLEQVLHEQFILKGKSLGLAESCTGGFIAHHLTQVPGSSIYFKGGIVCYQTSVKENVLGVSHETILKNGEVSEATAIELAKGAMKVLNVDCALAVTGLLGPASAEDKETVGTVWMAVASMDSVVSRKFVFHYDRIRNKEMAVSMGMLMIHKYVSELN